LVLSTTAPGALNVALLSGVPPKRAFVALTKVDKVSVHPPTIVFSVKPLMKLSTPSSFIPSFLEIKESAGAWIVAEKNRGCFFLELALIAILNAVGEPPEFRPSGGQMNPGHDNGGGTQGYYV
jgi:hypothetical protein